jgi:hypothetical protein
MGCYVASLDSTGVKIHGQGEWNRKKYNQKDRRQWVKVYLIIDVLPNKINKVLGDGAYDTLEAHKTSLDYGIELVGIA